MINEKDLKILVELRKDSRARLTDISKRTGIPISTIYDRLKNKQNNIISKNVSLINFDMLGFNARAKICIKCGKKSKNEIKEHLINHQNINSIFKINNGYDFLFEVVFKNIKCLEEFIEELEEKFIIKTKEVYYIIEEVQREVFFNNQLYIDLLK